jgi:hypothetical protein
MIKSDRIFLLYDTEFEGLKSLNENFCGYLYTYEELEGTLKNVSDRDKYLLYLTGNIKNLNKVYFKFNSFVIREYSTNFVGSGFHTISKDQIPVLIRDKNYNIGVYFKKYFERSENDSDYFKAISEEHKFQNLTEGNKDGVAFRRGLYITPVTDTLHFRLLRCSSNFEGPTENFRKTDKEIVNNLNSLGKYFFPDTVFEFNHILAQTYYNFRVNKKEKKAKIKAHSDKTKDMMEDSLMAFCTFYERSENNERALTTLKFHNKETKENTRIVLHPNSLLLIPLSTNRLFTHEIVPPSFPPEKIPTRMGYVVRCSKTKAVYEEDQTSIIEENGNRTPLHKMTEDERTRLKALYATENSSTDIVIYDKFFSSMNEGDYMKPNI